MNWPLMKLGEVAEVKIGPFGSLLHQDDYVDDGIALVNPMHIRDGRIFPDRRHGIMPEKASLLSNYRLAEGDVVLARRGEMGRCAVVRDVENGFLCGTGSLIVRPGPLISSAFLSRLLSSPAMVRTMERESLGTTMPNLNQAIVSSLPIPLPPLDEQRRIAAILDQANQVRLHVQSERDAVIALKVPIFSEMFGKREPDAKLGDYADVQGGLQVSGKRAALPVKLSYLRVANVYRDRLDLLEIKTIRATQAEADRTRLVIGDLLFVEGHGNPDEVGRAAVWDGSIPNCVHQNHLIRVRLNQAKLLPEFAVAWFNSPSGASYFKRAGKTTSGLNTISASQVRSAPIPVPSLDEQREFTTRCEQISHVAASCDRSMRLADELVLATQSRAFAGGL